MSTNSNGNFGHGHVYPRPDGARARCGGPSICLVCSRDKARKDIEDNKGQENTSKNREKAIQLVKERFEFRGLI